MDERGLWSKCRLISLDGKLKSRQIGPDGSCDAAGWSTDGAWMFLTTWVNNKEHLWRQRFPDGTPEQMTFGPLEEDGIAVERSGTLITSLGTESDTLWMHSKAGERELVSEGRILALDSPATFSADGTLLYLLRSRASAEPGYELWRVNIASGHSESIFPGVAMLSYNVSVDGRRVVYSAPDASGKGQLWIAPLDRSSPAKKIGRTGEMRPKFTQDGWIVFEGSEGGFNYLEKIKVDGSGRMRLASDHITYLFGLSPGNRWAIVSTFSDDDKRMTATAIPLSGGKRQTLCDCFLAAWSLDGHYLLLEVEQASRTNAGKMLAMPVGPREDLSALPLEGVPLGAGAEAMPGAIVIDRASVIPGFGLDQYAFAKTVAHRNLYRVSFC